MQTFDWSKVVPLIKSFPTIYVACHLQQHISKKFPTFSGWESNWYFDSWPFFFHNLCFKYSNGSCKPILHSTFQEFSNGINNSSIQWVLTPEILIWNSKLHRDSNSQNESPLGNVWVHSLTLLGVQMWFPGCTLSPHLSMPLSWLWT
jgi:hypothetical protein